MKFLPVLICFIFVACHHKPGKSANIGEVQQSLKEESPKDSVVKIEMKLSAFGVESDNFPNIDAEIDFIKNSGICKKSYYNPANEASVYSLTKNEMENLFKMLQDKDLRSLKNKYTESMPDQPSSTTIIYTKMHKYEIQDYGLIGDYPLKDLYKIVYKL